MNDPELERLIERLRKLAEDVESYIASRDQAESEEPTERPKLRLIKGGLLGVAVAGALDWGRSHPAVLAAGFVAAVAAVATWSLWPGDNPSPAGEPPGRQPASTATATATVTSSLTARPTATRTPTITTIGPTSILTVATIEPTGRPTGRSPVPTATPTRTQRPTATPTRTSPPTATPPPVTTKQPRARFCVRVRLEPPKPLVCVRTPPLPSKLW